MQNHHRQYTAILEESHQLLDLLKKTIQIDIEKCSHADPPMADELVLLKLTIARFQRDMLYQIALQRDEALKVGQSIGGAA